MPPGNRPRGATALNADSRSLPQLRLPRPSRAHLLAAAVVAGALALGFALSDDEPPAAVEPAVDILARPAPLPVVAPAPLDTFPARPPQPAAPPEPAWNEQTVRSGDNLSLIFKRAGFTTRDVHAVVSQSQHGKELATIFPGQTIAFQAGNKGELVAVRHIKSGVETVTYRLGDSGFSSEKTTREPTPRTASTTGVITSSLFMAGQEAGLSQNMIMEMANIFGGVIDFVGDPRKGDTMHLVYNEMYLDGEKYADGEIIAASYTNRGKTYTAYRYEDSNGEVSYYNEDGVSMRKAFLLAPVDFTRISSNFNPRRVHPIYKTARPHRGTDYAAPRGTPVYAAGDGRVIKAGYSSANGNYVFIQHGEQFVTRYLHLHKRNVKQGQRVSQSQVIGTVGSTGAATGPHLHYEFLMDGVHRNPRTIHAKLPKAKSLPPAELPRFQQSIASVASQLAELRNEQQVALADAGDKRG